MRKLKFAENEFYHVFNRGVDKRTIFYDKEDHDRFRAYLYLLNDRENMRISNLFNAKRKDDVYKTARGEQLVAIGAYCLMPNHFHLLLTPLCENGISKFMQRLQTAYTMFFNEKRKRSGVLLQGTFKAKHIDSDTYLKYMFAYIHLNPAHFFNKDWTLSEKNEIENYYDKVEQYEYSSIMEYLKKDSVISDLSRYPEYLLGTKERREHLKFWYKYKQDFASDTQM